LMIKMDRIGEENIRTLGWIAKLNRKIDMRAFGYKTQIYRDKERA
jgi:hypothetical protein